MLAEPVFDHVLDDDDWLAPAPPLLSRTASAGNSWGVTHIGRGFDWNPNDNYQAASSPSANPFPDKKKPAIRS